MLKRPGWDARRRNRNIGTAKAGHGQDNCLNIPHAFADERWFHEKLKNPVVLKVPIHSNVKTLIVEPTKVGFVHACTPDDIKTVLELLPEKHLAEIEMVVLRQPKKKERILSSVWGRLRYHADIVGFSGPAIHLEAQLVNDKFTWAKSMTPEWAVEFDKLRSDGHKIVSDRRNHHLMTTPWSVRYTQLFRTLPHEVGHWVDYYEKVRVPSEEIEFSEDYIEDYSRLSDLYFSRPAREREDFAHRYADEFFAKWSAKGSLPFDHKYDEARLIELGLKAKWFKVATPDMV